MMKAFYEKYKHGMYVVYYMIFYLCFFCILETFVSTDNVVMTSTWIDDCIPFNEYFVIPYVLWFVFLFCGFCYVIFIDISGFKRTCFYLFTGMTTCLIIYVIYPTAQDLRPVLTDDNIFQQLVSFIYWVDTPTNVCPSIHVYNAVMLAVSLIKCDSIKNKNGIKIALIILAFMICLSTVMIKQHAFLDIIFALILCVIIYAIGKWKFDF